MNWPDSKTSGFQLTMALFAVSLLSGVGFGATALSASGANNPDTPQLIPVSVADLNSTMAQHAVRTTTETEPFSYNLKYPDGLTVLFNGCRSSKIEPCGCRALNLGGYDKEAAIVQTIRQANTRSIYLDGGGFFREFTDPSMRLQTWFLLKAMKQLDCQVMNVGFPDLRQGMNTIKYFHSEFKLPFISANIIDTNSGKPVFDPYKSLEIKLADGRTIKVAVVGVTSPSRDASRGVPEGSSTGAMLNDHGVPLAGSAGRWMIAESNGRIPWLPFNVYDHNDEGGAAPTPGPGGNLPLPVKFAADGESAITSESVAPYRIDDPVKSAAEWAARLKADHDVLILLDYTTIESTVRSAAELKDYDVVVASDYTERMEPIRPLADGPLMLCNDHEGKYVGVVEMPPAALGSDDQSAVISDQIPVLQSIAGVPEFMAFRNEFADLTEKLPLPDAPTNLSDKIYAGVTSCKTCHVDEYNQWKTHKHSKAMKTLVDKNMHYNPDCLKCHTVAYRMPGGFTDLRVTANLSNVQCEVCHGPAEAHVKQMRAAEQLKRDGKPVPPMQSDLKMQWDANFCMQCHDPNNDPHFNFNEDIQRVRHKNTAPQRIRPTTVSLDMM